MTAPKFVPSKTFLGPGNIISGRLALEYQIFHVRSYEDSSAENDLLIPIQKSTESKAKMHDALSSNVISYSIKVCQILLTIGKVSTLLFRVCILIYIIAKAIFNVLSNQQIKLACQSHRLKCEKILGRSRCCGTHILIIIDQYGDGPIAMPGRTVFRSKHKKHLK